MFARHRAARGGFTLVEMLVAAALAMVIMTILAGAFQIGLQTFRNLKVAGDLQERLRNATTVLKRDLSSPHFGPGPGQNFSDQPWGGPYLADQQINVPGWRPPREGFFRIDLGTAPGGIFEGPDGEGLAYSRSPGPLPGNLGVGHHLAFTIQRSGKTLDDVFVVPTLAGSNLPQPPAALMPPGVFTVNPADLFAAATDRLATRWAIVEYYLTPIIEGGVNVTTSNAATGAGNPLQLYRLQRLQRLVLPGDAPIVEVNAAVNQGVSRFGTNPPWNPTAPFVNPALTGAAQNVFVYNRSTDVVFPHRRPMVGDPVAFWTNENTILSDVISFEVRPLWVTANGGTSYFGEWTRRYPQPATPVGGTASADWPFDQFRLPTNPATDNPCGYFPIGSAAGDLTGRFVFDTWAEGNDPFHVAGEATPTNANQALCYRRWNPMAAKVGANDIDPNAPNETDPVRDDLNRPCPRNFVPLRVRVKALQIRLRVWDARTQTSRQVTFVQDV